MVFSQLCDQAAHFRSPLICTSGQPTVAVIRLLDMLAAAGTDLYYAGDFDGKQPGHQNKPRAAFSYGLGGDDIHIRAQNVGGQHLAHLRDDDLIHTFLP